MLVHIRPCRFGRTVPVTCCVGLGGEGESGRNSRRGVNCWVICSWVTSTESTRIQDAYRRNRFHSSWSRRGDAGSDSCVGTGGRSLTRTSKDLYVQSRLRTGSSKALQQQANEIAVESLISLVYQTIILRISSILKI